MLKKNHPESTGNLYPKGCSVSEAAGPDVLLCDCLTWREARRERGWIFMLLELKGNRFCFIPENAVVFQIVKPMFSILVNFQH